METRPSTIRNSRHLELTVTSLSGLAAQRMESSAGRQREHQVAVGSVSISDLEGEAEVQVLSRRRQHCINCRHRQSEKRNIWMKGALENITRDDEG